MNIENGYIANKSLSGRFAGKEKKNALLNAVECNVNKSNQNIKIEIKSHQPDSENNSPYYSFPSYDESTRKK